MVALADAAEILSKIDWELVQLVSMEDYDNSAQEVSVEEWQGMMDHI